MRRKQTNRRLERAKKDLAFLDAAYEAIVGGAQQYSLGSRSISRAQLSTIIAERNRLEDLIAGLEGPSGRFRRVVVRDG